MKTTTIKTNKDRCASAVSTIKPLSQQSVRSSQLLTASEKQIPASTSRGYRTSKISATMRIPHELRSKVQALVLGYRKQQHTNPDSWE